MRSLNQVGVSLAKKVLHTDKRTESMVGMKKEALGEHWKSTEFP